MRRELARRVVCVLALVLSAPGLLYARGGRASTRLVQLQADFFGVDRQDLPAAEKTARKLKILSVIASLKTQDALSVLAALARDQRYVAIRSQILDLLCQRYPDDNTTFSLLRQHMVPNDPYRARARDFLIQQAEKKGSNGVASLLELSRDGTMSDRFLALAALGRMKRPEALDLAQQILRDSTWKPEKGGVVGCATIAHALSAFEDSDGPRLLLLLENDPRFLPEDEEAIREATRLWRQPDLVAHIDMRGLADADPGKQAAFAKFLGEVGIEEARAPLMHLARRTEEPEAVRAAAVEALGGLSIARGALADTLRPYLEDASAEVRKAAVRALAHLRVQRAVSILGALPAGPLRTIADAALAKELVLPADTDWSSWVQGPLCSIPEGT